MINRFAALFGKKEPKQEVETQTTILQKKAGTYELECAVDEEVVDCDEMDSPPYIGVPAPAYLEDDPWFGMAPTPTEKQQDYMEQETEIKMVEEQQRSEETCESEDIHVKMYEIATQNWTTVAETQGGSENFQEGPGGWNSGTGINQFQR
jgi:hypothetical protein